MDLEEEVVLQVDGIVPMSEDSTVNKYWEVEEEEFLVDTWQEAWETYIIEAN